MRTYGSILGGEGGKSDKKLIILNIIKLYYDWLDIKL